MKRSICALAAAGAAGIALLVPAAWGNTPNGVGLFSEHESHCTGAALPSGEYTGPVTLTGGNSFWVNGVHLSIRAVTVTVKDQAPQDYSFGAKVGKSGSIVICEGDFPASASYPAYHVESFNVVVP